MSGIDDLSFSAMQRRFYLVAYAFHGLIGLIGNAGEAPLSAVNRSFDPLADLAFVIGDHAADGGIDFRYSLAAALTKRIRSEFGGATIIVDHVEGDGTKGLGGHGHNPFW